MTGFLDRGVMEKDSAPVPGGLFTPYNSFPISATIFFDNVP